jgi:hypothetical protein
MPFHHHDDDDASRAKKRKSPPHQDTIPHAHGMDRAVADAMHSKKKNKKKKGKT